MAITKTAYTHTPQKVESKNLPAPSKPGYIPGVPKPPQKPAPPPSFAVALRASPLIENWARHRGFAFEQQPDETWFRRFEPYDTLAPPSYYLNACTRHLTPGHIVVAEPWYGTEDSEPLARTLFAYAVHPGLLRRAAMRVGEHFCTRVAFIESPPPPKVSVGEKRWDDHVETFAASSSEANTAFHPHLRKVLADWGFQGHIELRPTAAIVHYAGLLPIYEHYERLFTITREIVSAALKYAR